MIPWWLKLAALAALALFLLGLKAAYDHGHEQRGYAKRADEDAPLTAICEGLKLGTSQCAGALRQSLADVAQLRANVDGLEKTLREQTLASQRLADAGTRARAAAAAAQKQADDDALFYAERLKDLRARIDHPSEDPNADADRVLRDYARELRRN